MRISLRRTALLAAACALVLGCQSDRLLKPSPVPVDEHPELAGIAIQVAVDVERGTARVLPNAGIPGDSGGPSFTLLGNNEIAVAISNMVRQPPVNNKVHLTFDVAITNKLTGASLVTPTFPKPPVGVQGVLLIPFRITNIVGSGSVTTAADWDGIHTPGSGAPFNFFNDFSSCPTASNGDCYRWEAFPTPLASGATTAAQSVGFSVSKTVSSFVTSFVLAADLLNNPPPPPQVGAISGHVTSPQQGALPNVAVLIANGAGATTDLTGGFQFTAQALGNYQLSVSNLPQGCTDPNGPQSATVLAGGIAQVEFSITCPPPPPGTGTVAGTVTSPTLGNLYGVHVQVDPAGKAGATDGAGAYSIPGVPAGQVTVTLSNLPANCTNPGTLPAVVAAGTSVAINFTVNCSGGGGGGTSSVVGRVTSPDPAYGALGGVTVTASPSGITTTTDNTVGGFSLSGLAPGGVSVSLSNLPAGCVDPGPQATAVPPGGFVTVNITVVCDPTAQLHVAVTLNGSPFAGLPVNISGPGFVVDVPTDANGVAHATGIVPQVYAVALLDPDRQFVCTGPLQTTVHLGRADNQTIHLDLTCGTYGWITVIHNVTSATPPATFILKGTSHQFVLPARNGPPVLLPPDSYDVISPDPNCYLVATPTGHVDVFQNSFDVVFADWACSDATTGVVVVTAVRSNDGSPISGQILSLDGTSGGQHQTTDSKGVAVFPGVAAGANTLSRIGGGSPAFCGGPTPVQLTVVPGPVAVVTFTFPCTPLQGNVEGHVVDRDGQPVAGVLILFRDPQNIGGGGNRTDANGYYQAHAIAGTYDVLVDPAVSYPPCPAAMLGTATIPAQQLLTLDLTIDCPPFVQGTVVASQGTLPPGLSVQASARTGPVYGGPVAADGSFSFHVGIEDYIFDVLGLPAGCTASRPGALTQHQQQLVNPSIAVDCPVPTGSVTGTITDLDGKPVWGAHLSVGGTEYAVTGSDGSYSISDFPPGTVTLDADQGLLCSPGSTSVAIIAGQTTTADFTLDCPAVVAGAIIAGIRTSWTSVQEVQIREAGTGVVYQSLPVGPDEFFSFVGRYGPVTLQRGMYDIIPIAPGCTVTPQSVTVQGQQGNFAVNFDLLC